MIDPNVIDKVVSIHLQTDADYALNTMILSYPDGLDFSIIKFRALEEA